MPNPGRPRRDRYDMPRIRQTPIPPKAPKDPEPTPDLPPPHGGGPTTNPYVRRALNRRGTNHISRDRWGRQGKILP